MLTTVGTVISMLHILTDLNLINNPIGAFLVAQTVKNPPAMQETRVQSLGRKDLLEKGRATHCNIVAWRIQWTEEPGGLQSMNLQRVRYS